MEKLLVFGLLFLVHQSASEHVIYKLSKAEYSRMPPKNNLDRFDHCLDQPNGVYCTAHADVVSDGPSELLDMMRGYSAHRIKHYNYTNLIYGLCLTRNCRSFYNGSHDEADLRTASEACLNQSLSAEYGLKTRVNELNCYFENKSNFTVDWLDCLFTLFMLGVFALNIVGTVYDFNRDQTKPGNPILRAFSLRVNWNQFLSPPSSDPRTVLLKPIHGIRAITSFLVIMGHFALPLAIAVENPTWLENAHDVFLYHTLAQGHLITSTFLMISGFLLAYISQIQAETRRITWKMLPKAIFTRWLRLTPINIVSLLLSSSWLKFAASGPLWEETIGREVHDCRNYWYYNLFYLNNLVDHSQCIMQTWSLACDMHYHIIGLCIITLTPSARVRWWVMGALFTIGFAWPAYYIYSMDLDAALLATPTVMTEFFMKDPTFNWVYKRTHANMPVFIFGMAFGYFVYDWQRKNVFAMDMKKYRYLYWSLYPVVTSIMASAGLLFYRDAPRASIALRLIYGPLVKIIFISGVILVILGTMFKVENVQRSIIEWSGWVPLSRISYCIFSFHVAILRFIAGTRTTLVHFSLIHLIQDYAGVTVITLQIALVFYLFVEAPFGHLIKIILGMKSPVKPAADVPAVNGVAVNGAAVNGTEVNVVAVNGSKVNNAVGNGNAVNGAVINETALNGTAINSHTLMEPATMGGKDKDA